MEQADCLANFLEIQLVIGGAMYSCEYDARLRFILTLTTIRFISGFDTHVLGGTSNRGETQYDVNL